MKRLLRLQLAMMLVLFDGVGNVSNVRRLLGYIYYFQNNISVLANRGIGFFGEAPLS